MGNWPLSCGAADRWSAAPAGSAQKPGGILRIYHRDSPASMSIHEEATFSAVMPMMGVFNNLVMFDQHVAAEQPASRSCPTSPTSWAWSEDGTELTFKLRQGVKWHDGKPFTAADVKCTCDLLLGKGSDKLRLNPRKAWYGNLDEVDRQRRRRGDLPSEAAAAGAAGAARLGLLADLSLPRPAGADAAAPDRHRPVQIRRVQAERVHQARAQPGLLEAGPALSRRHRVHDHPEPLDRDPGLHRRQVRHDLARTSVTVPLLKDIARAGAAGDLRAGADQRHRQPADQPRQAAVRQRRDLRRAMALTLDRKAFIDILDEGQGRDRRRDAAAAGRASGACRRRCCRRCPATAPTSRRTAPRRARS